MAALNLRDRVTFEELLTKVTAAHGKPIELQDIDNTVIPTVTGLWIETTAKSMILLPAGDHKLHRIHAVCHEFGHMLLGHESCGGIDAAMPSIFRHVGGRRGIKQMLARSLGWNETEQAAERVAYLLSSAMLPKEPESPNGFERTFT
ncbi:hypothetical protein ANMWB30_24310 [Arthrobacter sp. MWB30]|nr:hypothetical protein ANMWB30_24310 [Arthrobacter sp. MWB30]